MDSTSLLLYLGHSPASEPFNAWLDDHRVFDRPHSPEQDEEYDTDPNVAFENARASEIDEVERDSLCLIYDARRIYELIYGEAKTEGDYILRQVAFYAKGVQGYQGYRGELPLHLRFDLDQAAVHALLGVPVASRHIHELLTDLYISEQLVINVCYLDAGASVGIVHVRLPHIYDLQKIGKLKSEPQPRAVNLTQLISCLGRSAYDEQLEALLEPMGWKSSDFEMADCDEVPNLVARYGLALYYRDAKNYPALAEQRFASDGAVFAGFRANRRGDMSSDGYDGELPFGIQYYFSPEQAIACIGRDPDWISVGDDIGSYKWKLSTHTIHVMFSLIDYQIYRVSCFAKFLEEELFARPG